MREMKDSGIEWIGEIPVDWELSKIGAVYEERNEKVSDADFSPLSVTKQGVVPQLETAAKTNDGENRKLIRKNDFVINSRSDRRGSCGISEYDGSCSLINTVLKPRRNMCNAYYSFVFRSERFADEFYRWGNGIVDDLWSTKWSNMKRIYIPAPSLQEQRCIADYLDRKCSQIDAIIARQQEVTEKLKAYKLSVITEAVTKGLKPNVPMKDSGVEWIGEIPEHWKLSHIGNLVEMGSGGTPARKKPEYWENGNIPWMSSGEINDEYIYSTAEQITELGLQNSNAKILPVNTVMLGLIGQGKTKGLTAILKTEVCCNQNLAYLIADEKYLHYRYLFYCFKAMYFYIRGLVGESQAGIYSYFLKKLHIPLPDIEQQIRISDYLDTKCEAIKNSINKRERIIEKFTSYKRSLIYEVVTGRDEQNSWKEQPTNKANGNRKSLGHLKGAKTIAR